MKHFIFALSLFAISLCSPTSLEAKAQAKQRKGLTAKAFLVVDDSTGKIVTSRSRGAALPIASTTKLLTALAVVRHGKLDDPVRISATAAAQVPSKAGLVEGEIWTRRELLKALLIKSANDAAVALAEDVSGSEESFCKKITSLAASFGCQKTHIKRASGLNAPGQHSCASDLAIISRKAFAQPLIRQILNMKTCTIRSQGGRQLEFRSHNKLLHDTGGSVPGKTGFTKSSGKCFAGRMMVGGRSHTVVILGSKNLWGDLRWLRSSAASRVRRSSSGL